VKKKKPEHELCAFSLKGHSDLITSLAFDPKGNYLMSTSKDRTIRIWHTNDYAGNKNNRIQLENYATVSAWSGNGKAIVVALEDKRNIEVYQISKKENGSIAHALIKDFPGAHDKNIHSLVTCRNYIVSCSGDTIAKIWDFEGGLKDVIDTKQMKNYSIAMSRTLKYLAISSSLGVRIYKFINNAPEGSKEKYELGKHHFTSLSGGHDSEVTCLDFLDDEGNNLVSSSNDGTWRLWNLDGDYKRGFEPKTITICVNPLGKNHPFSKIAVSNDGQQVATVTGNTLIIFTITGDVIHLIEDAHKGIINALAWSIDGQYVATGDSVGSVRLFNVR